MIAAPMPWTARAPIMKPAPVASAAARDAALNSPSPSIRMRRRPSRSAARPPRSKNPPNVSAYAVTTHCRLVWEKCRSRPIVGSETLTIVRSMTVMKNVKASSANARQRLIWGDCDVIRPPVLFGFRHPFWRLQRGRRSTAPDLDSRAENPDGSAREPRALSLASRDRCLLASRDRCSLASRSRQSASSVDRRLCSSARSTALALSAIARSYARAAATGSPARRSRSACAACSGW